MTVIAATPQPVLLNPDLAVPDPLVAWWLAQVTLRLRRETAWWWHLRGGGERRRETARWWHLRGDRKREEGELPPFTDAAVECLDLTRYSGEKRRFFAHDVAARYLSERLEQQQPLPCSQDGVGSWQWLARNADLNSAAQFALALALAARLDAALGPVFACCQNDATRPYPTLALAQRLWDDPLVIAACASPAHALRRFCLLSSVADGRESDAWLQPLDLPAMLVPALADPAKFRPTILTPVEPDGRQLPEAARGLAAHLAAAAPNSLQLVPLIGGRGADYPGWAAALAAEAGRHVARVTASLLPDRANVASVLALCWLRDTDFLVPDYWHERAATGHATDAWFSAVLTLPVRCYLPTPDGLPSNLPAAHVAPALQVPALGFAARVERLEAALGGRATALRGAVREAARRFRLDELPLQRAARSSEGAAGTDQCG